MDFISVMNGLQQGNVYRNSDWCPDEYLILTPQGAIKRYDYGEIKDFALYLEDALSETWELAEKDVWYITRENMHFHMIRDDVHVDYDLAKEEDDSWNRLTLTMEEMKEWKNYIQIRVKKEVENEEYQLPQRALEKLTDILQ